MTMDETHIRHCILYEYSKGSSAAKAARNITAVYGKDAVSTRKCQRWFKRFSTGNYVLQDSPRTGRPKVIDKYQLKEVVEADPTLTARELGRQLNASHTTITTCLRELGKVSKLGVWVSRDLVDTTQMQQEVVSQQPSQLNISKHSLLHNAQPQLNTVQQSKLNITQNQQQSHSNVIQQKPQHIAQQHQDTAQQPYVDYKIN